MPDIDIDFCMNRRGEVIDYVTRQVRPRQGRPDHHLRHHGREGRHQRRRPRAWNSLWRRGPHRQDGARRRSASPSTRRSRTRRSCRRHTRTEPAGQRADRHAPSGSRDWCATPACMRPAWSSRRSRSPTWFRSSARKNDEIVTAYDMKAVEKMGLLKMDFLGLTTLTVIDDCAEADRAEQQA